MLRLPHFALLCLLAALACTRAHAQTTIYDCYNGSSEQGGNRVTVNGIQTNQYVQQSWPGATVTVYVHNTLTLATIFQDEAGLVPLANPFSSSAHGVAFVCAADGRYDFKYSGSTITTPYTVSDIKFCFACSGGGSGSVNGTPPHVAKFTGPTAVGDSSGLDPGNTPTQWPLGLNVIGNAGYVQKTTGTGGSVANELVSNDASANAIVTPAGTAKALGIADAGVAIGAAVPVAVWGYHNCIFDNQTTANDYVGPSTTTDGQCSDLGATKPNNVEIVGVVTTVNTGVGSLAIVDLFTGDTVAPGSSGGSGTVANCGSSSSNAFYISPGTVVNCDPQVTDDNAGNLGAQSLALNNPTYAGFYYQKYGPLPPAVPAGAIMYYPPTSGTTYSFEEPGAPGSTGNCWKINSQSTDASGNTIDHMIFGSCGGAGVEIQTNGVDNLSQVLLNIQSSTSTFGYQVTATNGSGGNVTLGMLTPITQISTPTAPTLSTNGAAGATSITYKIVGCQDGPICAYHTPASAATTIATANATLTSVNSVNVTLYADTLYGPRCYNVYRTAAGGTPSSLGLVANCAWKSFIDTGLVGDASTAPTTNTTQLLPSPLPLPGCNVAQGQPMGIDAPPCTPFSRDDEFTSTFGAPGDVNSPFWTWVNQNSCTSTLTNGMMSISCPDRATAGNPAQLNCLMKTLPAAPYTITIPFYYGTVQAGQIWPSIAFRESATGKLVNFGPFLEGTAHLNSVLVGHWTNATTLAGFVVNQSAPAITNPAYYQLVNDSTNIILKWSSDGIVYDTARSETIASFFTTAPDQYGVCLNTTVGIGHMDVDYARSNK